VIRNQMTLALGLLMFLAVAAGCGGKKEAPAASAPTDTEKILSSADVAVVRTADIASGVVVTGTLNPSEVVDVKAQASGTVASVSADRGVAVKRGQRLAVIDAEGIRSQVSGAQAGVAAAQSGITAAEANLAAVRQKLEGARKLHDAGAMSTVDFQAIEAQYQAAVGQVASAQSQSAAAQSQLAGASETARRTTVVAPISGTVSKKGVNEGEAVTVGQSLFTIVNSQTLELAAQIPVQQASLARVGQTVSFTLDAYPGRELAGRVARIDPVADPATRRVGIALQIPNTDGGLVGGQFVTGKVITANVAKGLIIPKAGLRGDDKTPFVFVIDGDRVARRDVTPGPMDDASATVPVQSGLKEGDRVIVSPATDIQVGAKVREGTSPQPAKEMK
jgi:RND family efflux transporter MFP subunit